MKTLGIIGFLTFFSFNNFARLDTKLISSAKQIIKKHKIEEGLTSDQKFHAYVVLAFELETHGHLDMALEYYNKARPLRPTKVDPLEVETAYLFALYKKDPAKARTHFPNFKKVVSPSKDEKKKEILEFWNNVFNNSKKLHQGFYGQFFKDKNIKELMEKKEYSKALGLKNPTGLENASINSKLEYDVLSRLNGKKNGFYCEKMLNKYPNSYSVAVEMCRYIKDGKLKYKGLPELIKRTDKEAESLNHIVKALKDIKK